MAKVFVIRCLLPVLVLEALLRSTAPAQSVQPERLTRSKYWAKCLPNGALDPETTIGNKQWESLYRGDYNAQAESAGGWDNGGVYNGAMVAGQPVAWYYRSVQYNSPHVYAIAQTAVTQNYNLVNASSRMLSHITGVHVQPNKAIVGENAFAHEAGIHQDGVLKEKLTYEIMRPEDIGRAANKLVMGKHSGRHALAARLRDLGLNLDEAELGKAFKKFKDLADKKKEIFDEDLLTIVKDEMAHVPETYVLDYLHMISGTGVIPSATVRLRKEGQLFQDSGLGDGPVDAVLNAIDAVTGHKGRLQDYQLRAVTSGKDAIGEVTLRVEFDGTTVTGKGASTDVVEASARAYVNALNRLVRPGQGERLKESGP